MFRFIQTRYFVPLILVLITLPAVRFLIIPGQYWNMQDDMQIVRQLEFEKCLKDGQIPCRWVPDLGYGYGYPLFNFYPPLPSIIGQLFRWLAFPFMETVKAQALLHFFIAGITMYLLIKDLYKSRFAAIFSAIFYIYAPYRALNIYVRGAMNEAWASVFFPLIFLFTKKIIFSPSLNTTILLSLSITGLLLSHNAMALIFFPFTLVWIIYWLFRYNQITKIKSYLHLLLSGVLGISLSAFFTLPVLFETKYVQINTMFQNYFSYLAHFKSLYQIFISNFWSDGPSVWGGGDGMSFMIGYLHWFLPLLILFHFLYQLIIKKRINTRLILPSLLCLLGFISLFFIHGRSAPVWNLFKPLQIIQFPWRFLNPATFLLTVSLSVIPVYLSKAINQRKSIIISLILIVMVFATNISHFYPVTSGPLTDQQKFSGLAWRNLVTGGIYDYLPKTAKIAALKPAAEFIDDSQPPINSSQLLNSKKGTDWMLFDLDLNQTTQIIIAQLAFPNFKIYDNYQPINYTIDPELGRMVISLPPGWHQIYIKLTDTPIRIIGNYLSLISILLITFYSFKNIWTKLISKK